MILGLGILLAVLFYLLLLGASRSRDWDQEDREQAEYLRQYRLRREQRKKRKCR